MNTIGETLETAVRLRDAGQLVDAERLYVDVLKSDARQSGAWHGLGLIAQARGDIARAVECFSRAVVLKGDDATYHNDLGAALHAQQRLADAAASFRRAVSLKADYAEAHCNLGSAYKDLNRPDEAIACYQRAINLNPRLAEAHFNLGVVYQQQARLDDALASYERAVAARPDYWHAQNNLGTVYKALGRFDDALAAYERALACQGDVAEAHRNRALLRLLLGNFEDGWPEYEWRWQVAGAKPPNVSQPRWQGQPIPGGTVLLKSEQGLGDAIQFVRYARMVKERSGARVLLECSQAIQPLLSRVEGIDGFAHQPWEQEAFDCFVPLLSLPTVFQTRVNTIPGCVPYLSADPERIARWREALAAYPGYKVGIAWQGNPGYAGDATRSIPLVEFAPLAGCPGVNFFSLQKQHGREQLAEVKSLMAVNDFGESLDADAAFVDTAALITQLDLIVTSDTAIAHLAGALGAPVWVALQRVPDWRWLLDREDSPWYPTARLFRQGRAGDWRAVFERIAVELRSLSATGRLR